MQGEERLKAFCEIRPLIEPVDDRRAIDEHQCAIRQTGQV
jgi:hypothetical protein